MSPPRRPDSPSARVEATAFADDSRGLNALELVRVYYSRRNLNDLLAVAARRCAELVGARRARVWVQKWPGSRLSSVDPEGPDGTVRTELRLAPGEGLAGRAISRGELLRLGPGDPRPALEGEAPGFEAALVVPLFRHSESFAAIECLDSRNGPAFTAEDADRLRAAGEHVALALDNALLHREAERRALEKDVLLEVSMTLSSPLELDEVLDAILRSLRQVVRYDAASIYLVNRRTRVLEQVRQVGYPAGSDQAFELQVGQGVVGWVAKTGTAAIVPDTSNDARYVAARDTTRSEVATPLLVEGETVGVFNLESDRPDEYHEEHLELLAAFASQAAMALERARLMRDRMERRHLERELGIAREIQSSFLPKSAPQVPDYDLAGRTLPHAEVGGDYFDFIRIGENRLGIAIADVSGKGIPAALIMAGFRASLLAEIRNEFAIRAVMSKVNSLLLESSDRGKFVTCFYGLLDLHHRALIACNAGHNPPLLRRADGRIEYLTEGGVALGVLPGAHYDDRPLALHPGDVLVLYTDGVTESLNAEREAFDQDRLEATVQSLHHLAAREILDGIVKAALDWSGEENQSDDLTVVVVKVK
jgi:sigma-B regulation protein RsbU (phosphoserine phosphatase)